MAGGLAIAGALAPIIGGLIGQGQAAGAETDAENARKEALSQFAAINAPSIQDMLLNLEEYQSAGTMNPLLENLVSRGPSGFENIQEDPRLRAQQMQALEQMAGLASGQPSSADMASFELARRNVAGDTQAKQQQILQEMQARGQGGSGAELMARLKGAQAGADRLSQAQMEEAKLMQNARMQALMQQGNMSQQIRAQDYNKSQDLAQAQDAISAFNAQNAQGVNSRNTGTQNDAQRMNLTNAQNIANSNTGMRNEQQAHNKNLNQTNFNNQMNLAGARAGQYNNQAAASQAQAAGIAGMWSGIGQGVGSGLNAYGQKNKASADEPGYGTSGGFGQNGQN